MGNEKGFCLASQQLWEQIVQGNIVTPFTNFSRTGERFNDPSLEMLVQPSSLEPQLTADCFILDTETKGIFRPQHQESIYRTLLQLPGRQRQKVSLADGFELRKGFTYLLPLAEKVKLTSESYIKSSPKSSYGRLFVHTRLLADYNPCYDEIHGHYHPQELLQLWLLLQPLAFNLIVYPGLTLNQLRFFQGKDAQLSSSSIEEEFSSYPLLRRKEGNDLAPIETPIITEDGLQIHLDLSGRDTEGIVALRARHNPLPLDLKKKGEYDAEHFFEPVVQKQMTIRRGEYYLLSSAEILTIPPHLNVELESHSHIGIHGPLHFAGFVDNGFQGDLVFEVRSDEIADMELSDGMPISKLKVYRTAVPDKLYGEASGAHYQLQVGPRPAKFFKPFDFTLAARNYEKLDRLVLVQDALILNRHCHQKAGFEFIVEEEAAALFKDIERGFFQSRYDCEFDELILQIIPYVILFGPNQQVFSYVRASNIKEYGDRRLFGKHSIGLGGHILPSDAPQYVLTCLEREVKEEVEVCGWSGQPKLAGTLMAYDQPVDRVHFGLIYTLHTEGSVQLKESSLVSGKMMPLKELVDDPDQEHKFETWSRILIPFLPELCRR
ncbi:MAG: 2'-deoxycytidine 5'-triphosphate deaminase [Nanoarchaeota archaeon]